MRIVIIEDEILIGDRLWEILSGLNPNIKLVHRMRSIQEGLNFFKDSPDVDLIFSDIELLDGQSFEIFRQYPQSSPIIFCTAFDEYALQAFEVNGIDYILKPFSTNRIAKTLKKYERLTKAQNVTDISALTETIRKVANPTRGNILAYIGDKIIPIAHQDVALIHLENGITNLYTMSGQQFRIDQKMEALETELGSDFYRLNRQVIIQRKAVAHASNYFARKLKVSATLKFDKDLIVSKAGSSSFLRWLAQG